jgi:hypothetical protein
MSLQQEMRARPVFWIGTIFVLFLIAIFLRIGDFIDFSRDTLQSFGLLKSQAFRLAEYTNRSNFTDNLTRMAWRRMHWGRLAARRVHDEAPLADIDSAWSAYINAAADWNAEVMIFIVGLDRYYDRTRRPYFEDNILPLFAKYDEALGNVRRSKMMRKLRASQTPDETDRAEFEHLYREVTSGYDALNIAMYDFASISRHEGRRRNRP